MEKFKKQLVTSNYIYWLFIVLSIIGAVLVVVFSPNHRDGNGTVGFFAAMIAISVINIHRNRKALKNEKLLKEMYINSVDERKKQITLQSAKASFFIILASMLIASIVFRFISMTVSIVLTCCMMFILIVYFAVTAYYNKKM